MQKVMWYSKNFLHIVLVGLAIICSLPVLSNNDLTYERSVEIYRSFKAQSNSSVEVVNKHGDIYVNTWQEDSVAFMVTIEAYAEKEDLLDNLIDMIEINLLSIF